MENLVVLHVYMTIYLEFVSLLQCLKLQIWLYPVKKKPQMQTSKDNTVCNSINMLLKLNS